MMKSTTFAFCWVMLSVFPARGADGFSEFSERRWYLAVDVGPAFCEDIEIKTLGGAPFNGTIETKTDLRLDLDWGYRLSRCLSAEIEAGFIHSELETVGQHDFFQIPLMANLKFAWPNSSRFRPYAGIGIGGIESYAETTVGPGQSDSDFGFGYQALAGVELLGLNNHLSLGLNYRYLVGSDLHFSEGVVLEGVRTHSFTVSLTWAF